MFDYNYLGNRTMNAATNMAIEEYMLRNAAADRSAYLRFFDFPQDSVIVGYAQAMDPIKRYGNFELARRPTGGSHVQVGSNVLAYSFAVPRNGQFSKIEDMRAYYADKVAEALRELGIETVEVDNKASTVNVDNKIVASHAMIWGIKSALLHGLIVFEPYDIDALDQRLRLAERKIGGRTYTEYSAIRNIPALSSFLDHVAPNIGREDRLRVMKGVVAGTILDKVTEGRHKEQYVDDRMTTEAFRIAREKYTDRLWTVDRKPPFTEAEIEEIPGEELNGALRKNLGYCLFLQVDDHKFKKMADAKE